MSKIALMFLVVVNEIKRPEQLFSCVVPIAMGVILQGAVAIVQYLKGGLLGLEFLGETTAETISQLAATSVQGQEVFRPSALLWHANILGIYLAGVLPLLIGSCFLTKSTFTRILIGTAILLGTVALIFVSVAIILGQLCHRVYHPGHPDDFPSETEQPWYLYRWNICNRVDAGNGASSRDDTHSPFCLKGRRYNRSAGFRWRLLSVDRGSLALGPLESIPTAMRFDPT